MISIYEKKAEDFRLHFPGRAVTMYSLRKTMEEKREIGRQICNKHEIPTDKNDHWTEVTRPDDGVSDFSEAVEQMKINNQTELIFRKYQEQQLEFPSIIPGTKIGYSHFVIVSDVSKVGYVGRITATFQEARSFEFKTHLSGGYESLMLNNLFRAYDERVPSSFVDEC